TAGGREAVLVPEQHPEIVAVIVGRGDEAAVHVRMTAWFEAQQPPQIVDGRPRYRTGALLRHRGTGDLDGGVGDDAEGLTGRVIVQARADSTARHHSPIPTRSPSSTAAWTVREATASPMR